MEYNTTGYHTVEDQDNPDEIERFAPFKCVGTRAWLTPGYYFWDDDIEFAHRWGQLNYSANGYVICQVRLHLKNLLDLHGTPRHARELREHADLLVEKFPKEFRSKPSVSRIIAYLREVSKRNPKIFPYDSVRASDEWSLPENEFRFVEGGGEWTNLQRRIQICLFEKSPLTLSGVRIVFPEQYVSE